MSGTKKSIGALTVVLGVFGGAVLLGTGATAAVAGMHRIGSGSGSASGALNAEVQGVRSLDLEVSGAEMTVEFSGDATEAKLQIDGGSSDGWSLKRDGAELKVRGPHDGFDWFRPGWMNGDQRATLMLPDALSGIDADFTLQAGELTVGGDFGQLGVDVNAGSLRMDGTARELDAELNAGRADIDLSEVRKAEFTVNAGRIVASLDTVPSSVEIDVAAGALDLTVPDEEYDIRQDVTAGSLDSGLQQSSNSSNRITASVSAGSVRLHPAAD
jgi:hypothetical protein